MTQTMTSKVVDIALGGVYSGEEAGAEFSAPKEQTAQVQLQKAKGYTGKRSARSYIARIEGTDPQFGFAREFREPDNIDWGDSQLYKKNKGIWNEIHNLTPGVYEQQTFGDRRYLIVWMKNGKATWKAIPIERAKRIAGMLQDGTRFEQARRATKPTTGNGVGEL